MFAARQFRVGVGVAITDRVGGVSRPPYDGLNLADHVGDEPEAVVANRRAVTDALGLPSDRLLTVRQVHGADVHVADGPADGAPPEADAIVTREPGLVLAVLVADCVPVLLWDRRAGVLGAAHAGRRGLAAGVVPAAVEAMVGLGARQDRTSAVVGPGICAEHYEVPADLCDEVEALAPGSSAATRDGRPALDIRLGIVRQLEQLRLRSWVVWTECTAESPRFYSYRRDRTTGRFAGLVWRHEVTT